MKAQAVKNAVIVPDGAKGGFILKYRNPPENREKLYELGVHCYKNFIRALLDITDNFVDREIIPPIDVVRHDEDDPYLVVAADKGTASFSDIANSISLEYNFWLGDAFASGGSNGYDHKKMAITARGAWESVKRHFLNFDFDTQVTDFTVIGIGDMAGDVFGNGMLLSPHIKLVAAFNHEHIFIDPTPDSSISFIERKRLFNLPRSTWADYNPNLISKGGAVFNRKDKSLTLSNEIKTLLNIESDYLVPDMLIKAILMAKVDLLWNGGIGTYVKATQETDIQVGDKSNDSLRINGKDLRCKVVGEGGNLGFTQLGRIEYALNGGKIYTDFIDNSAGVDCSDHEVNLKILLNSCVEHKQFSIEQRNKLLANLSDEVAELVLQDNIEQTKAIDLALVQNNILFDLNKNFIAELKRLGYLNPELEFLPTDKELLERKAAAQGLTAPELAILLAYSKKHLKDEIIKMVLTKSTEAEPFLGLAFPKAIANQFHDNLLAHPLRPEIVATQLTNKIVNEMGSTFIYRMLDETGAQVESVVKAYMIARQLFNISELWEKIDSLGAQIDTKAKNKVTINLIQIIHRVTRWLLKNSPSLEITTVIQSFDEKIKFLRNLLPDLIQGYLKNLIEENTVIYLNIGFPKPFISEVLGINLMLSCLDITKTAELVKKPLEEVAHLYCSIDDKLNLSWLREKINNQATESHWEALGISALRDDLDRLHRKLCISVIRYHSELDDMEHQLGIWLKQHSHLIERWHAIEAQIRASNNISLVLLFVGLRELLELAEYKAD